MSFTTREFLHNWRMKLLVSSLNHLKPLTLLSGRAASIDSLCTPFAISTFYCHKVVTLLIFTLKCTNWKVIVLFRFHDGRQSSSDSHTQLGLGFPSSDRVPIGVHPVETFMTRNARFTCATSDITSLMKVLGKIFFLIVFFWFMVQIRKSPLSHTICNRIVFQSEDRWFNLFSPQLLFTGKYGKPYHEEYFSFSNNWLLWKNEATTPQSPVGSPRAGGIEHWRVRNFW